MVAPTNVRFPDDVDRALTEFVSRTGAKKSSVVVGAVREWIKMQQHPGIHFVSTTTGERRAATPSGPQVWQFAEAWLQHDVKTRTTEEVAFATGVEVAEVEAALGYWADNRAEIDEEIAREHAAQDEALAAWERRRALDAV
ncbi:hypothetical protein [Microbacterium sp.]|uniref:hypothetical protein n=1 Tax=Microbacterium sp. TaxID=51671 RepID=UPI003C70FEE7